MKISRRARVGVILLSMALSAGCMRSKSEGYRKAHSQQPGTAAGPRPVGNGLSWDHVTEKTACEALIPSACLGGAGFSVDQKGHYTIGPDAAGNHKDGQISGQELSQLTTHLNALVATPHADESCDSTASVLAGESDVIDLVLKDASSVRFYQKDIAHGICHRGTASALEAAQGDLHALLGAYYSAP